MTAPDVTALRAFADRQLASITDPDVVEELTFAFPLPRSLEREVRDRLERYAELAGADPLGTVALEVAEHSRRLNQLLNQLRDEFPGALRTVLDRLNRQRAGRVVAFVRAVPTLHDQRQFTDELVPVVPVDASSPDDVESCGTTACLAGWTCAATVLDGNPTATWDDVRKAVQTRWEYVALDNLGITAGQDAEERAVVVSLRMWLVSDVFMCTESEEAAIRAFAELFQLDHRTGALLDVEVPA